MRELAQTRVRFGYRRLRVLLLREGWEVGKERFYRVYTEEGLALATQAAVATRDGRASRAATTGDRAQRHLEHGLRRGRARRWATVPGVDGAGSVHARVPGHRRRAKA